MATMLLRPQSMRAGITAGLTGAITIEAFHFLVHWPGAPYPAPAEAWAWNASVLFGSLADGAAWAVPAGLLLHLLVSISWAFGYLYISERQPQLITRPIVSGLAYGLVVWVVMQALLIPIGKYVFPTMFMFDRDFVAHTVFFGLPLALVAARLVRQG